MVKNLLSILFGYFFGKLNHDYDEGYYDLTVKDSSYIPPYSGHLANRGDWINEDWYYKEPDYKKRYVNVSNKYNGYCISIDWEKYENSIKSLECRDQKEAELVMEGIIQDNKEINLKNNIDEFRYIYSFEYGDKIEINLSIKKYKKSISGIIINPKGNIIDIIACKNEIEALDLINNMKGYYKHYRRVIIKKYKEDELCNSIKKV
ncbi:MAG: hypothetical protein ACTHVE_11565 [Senegalia sp. (in: firmicutes)]|uniref:hypothetical protein n=1 Tax=Senegalia sp. (in: firmicutes) TaxID=1924098 RepID=UPI003F957558